MTIFDLKYNDLKNYFIIDDSVYEFVRENEDFFDLINKVKPFINTYFNHHDLILRVDKNPEDNESKLSLIVKVDYCNENIGELVDKLMEIDLKINQFKIDYGFVGKFLITLEGL